MPKASSVSRFRLSFEVPLARYFDLAREPLDTQLKPVTVAAKLALSTPRTAEFISKAGGARQAISAPLPTEPYDPNKSDGRLQRVLGLPLRYPPPPKQDPRDYDLTNAVMMEKLGLISMRASTALIEELGAPANLDTKSTDELEMMRPDLMKAAGFMVATELTHIFEAWGVKLRRFDLDKYLGIDGTLARKAVGSALREGATVAGLSAQNITSLFSRTAEVTVAQRAGVVLKRSGIMPAAIQYVLGKNAL